MLAVDPYLRLLWLLFSAEPTAECHSFLGLVGLRLRAAVIGISGLQVAVTTDCCALAFGFSVDVIQFSSRHLNLHLGVIVTSLQFGARNWQVRLFGCILVIGGAFEPIQVGVVRDESDCVGDSGADVGVIGISVQVESVRRHASEHDVQRLDCGGESRVVLMRLVGYFEQFAAFDFEAGIASVLEEDDLELSALDGSLFAHGLTIPFRYLAGWRLLFADGDIGAMVAIAGACFVEQRIGRMLLGQLCGFRFEVGDVGSGCVGQMSFQQFFGGFGFHVRILSVGVILTCLQFGC